MKKYIFDFKYKQSNSAGSKAKIDIINFLKDDGATVIPYEISTNRVIRRLSYSILAKAKFSKIKEGEFIFQYPLYNKKLLKSILYEMSNKKNLYKTVVIHDVESLRLNSDDESAIENEINILNQFDKVISHNKNMSDWLRMNGVNKKIVNLEIFDYDNPVPLQKSNLSDGISFAGNLEKSSFLVKAKFTTKIDVMGPNPKEEYPSNINYLGVYTPEEVPKNLNKKFGLVWDGQEIDTCSGLYGHYMKYNNPHKISLYLSSGIPVIVWSESAMSDFITDNNVGIVIKSLEEIDELLANISNETYKQMQLNAKKLAGKLREGFFISNAVNSLN
ncbi:hypothetical protein [Pediococcus pentosaceus]|uniref:hypothetical protein n=1 Tax=Pediococcus pentosaceus TaxID=1255 RepID=UPI00259B5DB0|nr:hypothetical protein [uncultured Pediococcus sp.]